MSNNNRNPRRIGVAVLGAAAAALIGAGSAHADTNFQISIDGYDLFPTADNDSVASSQLGDMAIAMDNGVAHAQGLGSFAFADGSTTNIATAGADGNFDSAWAIGSLNSDLNADTIALAGNGGDFDTALAFNEGGALAGQGELVGPGVNNDFDTAVGNGTGNIASATNGSFDTVFNPPLSAAADPAAATTPAADVGPLQLLFGDSGFNSWTPAADASLLSSDPTLAATLDTSVENFLTLAYSGQDAPLSTFVDTFDPSAFSGTPQLLFDGCAYGCSTFPLDPTGDFALGLDYTAFASGLDPVWEPTIALAETILTAPLVLLSLPFLGAA
jgi:hypothetical protein